MSDVVVVGSGAGGLTAALSAGALGADVTVLERTNLFGGTSAISGAGMWAANNRFMKDLGIPDSRQDAIEYLRRMAVSRSPGTLIETFVDNVNPALDFLSEHTNIEFSGGRGADYQPDLPGARSGRGVNPGLYDGSRLGELHEAIRAGWTEMPITVAELQAWGGRTNRTRWPWRTIENRRRSGVMGLGRALIGELVEACVKHDVKLVRGARARHLIQEGPAVVGVVTEDEGRRREWRATRGVVLACGGFEWNEELVRRHLGVPMVAPGSPPFNEGDALVMAMEAGASIANTSDAYWGVMVSIPGDVYEGHQLHRTTTDERGAPGSLIVNRHGRRFANEAMNYNDLAKVMMQFDPHRYDYPNLPCYFLFDAQFRREHIVFTVGPADPDPDWLHPSRSLEALAVTLGIDPAGLRRQVTDFNEPAARGEDPVFGRGGNAYDRLRGEAGGGSNPNLRPLGEGPFFGIELTLGCLGTKGGPVIDENGQVLDHSDQPIPGLYACGNAAVSVLGAGYASTLAPIVTFGYLAGRHIGRRR